MNEVWIVSKNCIVHNVIVIRFKMNRQESSTSFSTGATLSYSLLDTPPPSLSPKYLTSLSIHQVNTTLTTPDHTLDYSYPHLDLKQWVRTPTTRSRYFLGLHYFLLLPPSVSPLPPFAPAKSSSDSWTCTGALPGNY